MLVGGFRVTWDTLYLKTKVLTAKKTRLFTITKMNWLMQYRETVAVHSGIHTKSMNMVCGEIAELLNIKQVIYNL
jgi:hypothetical protein